jgi:hypothetical protein
MLRKLLCSLSLLVLACSTSDLKAAGPDCKPVQIAESTPCVKDQLKLLRDAKIYNETTTVTDNGEDTRTVTFIFEPKCLRAPTPCRIASRSVEASVSCKTGTATCP